MAITEKRRAIRKDDFYSLHQDGPFATPQDIFIEHPFTESNRIWTHNLTHEQRTQYRATRRLVFQLLGVDSYQEIHGLISNPNKKAKVAQEAYRRLGKHFEIKGSLYHIKERVDNYADDANDVIDYLGGNVFSSHTSLFEMANEVRTTSNPIDLILMMYDNKLDKKLRFEAKRKLMLMDMAASIDQREREINFELKFNGFQDFLDRHIWSPKRKTAESVPVYLLSKHGKEEFEFQDAVELTEQDGRHLRAKRGQKKTYMRRRMFEVRDKEYPAYGTVRKKTRVNEILKMIRSGTENPSEAARDKLGLLAVFRTNWELQLFYKVLQEKAYASGYLPTYDEIRSSSDGEIFVGDSEGSSDDVKMTKFIINMDGTRIEIILQTNEEYLNSRFKKQTAHEEYEIRRLMKEGIIDLLFPEEIYNLPENLAEKETRIIRKRIEDPTILG